MFLVSRVLYKLINVHMAVRRDSSSLQKSRVRTQPSYKID